MIYTGRISQDQVFGIAPLGILTTVFDLITTPCALVFQNTKCNPKPDSLCMEECTCLEAMKRLFFVNT